MLEGPLVRDELAGEPVEQFGVCGPLAKPTEVIRRAHEARAEMPGPNTVHHDPRRERVAGTREPLRELAPTAPISAQGHWLVTSDDARELARRYRAERQMVAAQVNSHVIAA